MSFVSLEPITTVNLEMVDPALKLKCYDFNAKPGLKLCQLGDEVIILLNKQIKHHFDN